MRTVWTLTLCTNGLDEEGDTSIVEDVQSILGESLQQIQLLIAANLHNGSATIDLEVDDT